VKVADIVSFTATGAVRMPANLRVPPMTPAGSSANCGAAAKLYGSGQGSPAPQLPCWSLIARVGTGGPVFAVGSTATVQVRDAGELYLGINQDAVAENTGAFLVTVHVGAR